VANRIGHIDIAVLFAGAARPAAFHKPKTDNVFELTRRSCPCRLGEVQGGRRGGVSVVIGDGDYRTQVPDLNLHTQSVYIMQKVTFTACRLPIYGPIVISQNPIDVSARRFGTIVAATAGLAAAMGVGRFAYTPLLPIMIDAAGLTPSQGAIVATANYAGYLAGAVIVMLRPQWSSHRGLQCLAAALVLSEVAMGITTSVELWSVLRFVAGLASAAIFVACVQSVSRLVTARAASALATGTTFAGVGIGIALTGVMVLVFSAALSWRELWIALASMTAVLLTPLVLCRPFTRSISAAKSEAGNYEEYASASLLRWVLLMAVYFLEGVGYIIVGTFLVVAVADKGNATAGPAVWIVVGVAAAPATLGWTAVAKRIGTATTLLIALITQAVGTFVPTISTATPAAVFAAVVFGGTFMGITALAIQLGNEVYGPTAAAPLTAMYGLGQILGPIGVAPVLGSTYNTAFQIAGTVLVTGAVLTWILFGVHRKHTTDTATEPSLRAR
jgi:predicted MFS family arabinose efflux permease